MYVSEIVIIFALSLCPEMQPHLYKNIVLTGGNTLFPGFRDRVYKEVRALAPVEYQVSVHLPQKYARENHVNINICVYGNYR